MRRTKKKRRKSKRMSLIMKGSMMKEMKIGKMLHRIRRNPIEML